MFEGIGGMILFDLIASFAISLAAFAILKYAKKVKNKKALKISAVVFAAAAIVIGLILIWLARQVRIIEPPIYSKPLYGVEAPIVNASCIQQCEQIADKAGEIFQNCIKTCRIR